MNCIFKSGKQNDVSHYFWKKISKLDIPENTRKKWRISIKDLKILGKSDVSQLMLMRYDFFAQHSDKIWLNCLVEFLIYFGGNCGKQMISYITYNPWIVAWWGNPSLTMFRLFSSLGQVYKMHLHILIKEGLDNQILESNRKGANRFSPFLKRKA